MGQSDLGLIREEVVECGFLGKCDSDREGKITRMAALNSVSQPMGYPASHMLDPASTAERWASYVLRGSNSDMDLKTLAVWAREIAVSYTTLCETCRLICVKPRDARDFARVWRAIVRLTPENYEFASVFDISDRRTLNSILDRAGFSADMPEHLSVQYFLEHQRFITRENAGLRALCNLLSAQQPGDQIEDKPVVKDRKANKGKNRTYDFRMQLQTEE